MEYLLKIFDHFNTKSFPYVLYKEKKIEHVMHRLFHKRKLDLEPFKSFLSLVKLIFSAESINLGNGATDLGMIIKIYPGLSLRAVIKRHILLYRRQKFVNYIGYLRKFFRSIRVIDKGRLKPSSRGKSLIVKSKSSCVAKIGCA